jgi:hypothetical protein
MSLSSHLKGKGEAYPWLFRRSVAVPEIAILGIDAPDVVNSINNFIAGYWAQLLFLTAVIRPAGR